MKRPGKPEPRPVPADGVLARLRDALRALALPADAQAGLLPSFTGGPDEFALHFDQCFRAASAEGAVRMSRAQSRALLDVDGLLDRMSGQDNARLWTTGALVNSREWTRLRKAARDALLAFGWGLEVPPAKPFEHIEW
ncbi:MAG TPA: hypothetical protein VGV60_13160 [Candidatus Polarisedimenticolia bacterium]|jgi:hypothetical protein|nr:hypothetical protein [Candidatus Polarisedimenticolia bacterium]